MRRLRQRHPEAQVLVHPESPATVIEQADVVGSTAALIQSAHSSDADTLIVATDRGIFHKMPAAAPDKHLIEAPTGGTGATCISCGHCPWMALNSLRKVARVLETGANEIRIDRAHREKALVPIRRLLEFTAAKTGPCSATSPDLTGTPRGTPDAPGSTPPQWNPDRSPHFLRLACVSPGPRLPRICARLHDKVLAPRR